MSGRRAAFRVAAKNARRNKKRTFYLLLLIGLPVMVAVMTSAYIRASYISPEELARSEYGSANIKIEQWASPDPGVTVWAREAIDDIDPDASVLFYRTDFKSFGPDLHGRVTDIDLEDPLSEGILALNDGEAPDAVGEVVLSEHLASGLGIGIGDSATLRLRGSDEVDYRVVGLASHPVTWSVDQVVVTPAEMDLINTNRQVGEIVLVHTEDDQEFAGRFNQVWEEVRYDFYPQDVEWPMPQELSFLPEDYYAAMTEEELAETRSIMEREGVDAASNYVFELFQNGVSQSLPQMYAESLTERLAWDTTNLAEEPPVVGTAVAAVILAEVAFIAGAAFATGTRRRLREIGLLGANGAATTHIKASVVSEGLLAGAGGGLLGTLLALGILVAGRPYLQLFVQRRIERFPLSLVDVAGPILVAVVACVIAAWLPAKTASAVPTLTALQGRMPVGEPKRWVIPVGLAITAFGTLLLAVGLAAGSAGAGVVAIVGVILMIGGTALLAGPIVAWVSKHAERFPITSRIVLRDSGRQRGRAAAAVSATMVIMMAPIAGLAGYEANEASQAIYGLGGGKPQILIDGRYDENYNPVPLSDADLAEVEGLFPDARIAVFQGVDARVEYPAELVARKSGNTEDEGGYYIDSQRTAIAGEELLAFLDDGRIEAHLAEDGMVLIGVEERETTIAVEGEEFTVPEVPLAVPQFSFPRLLVTEDVASRIGGGTHRVAIVEVEPGWFQNPFTSPFDPLWQSGTDEFSTSGGGGSDRVAPVVLGLGFVATLLVVLIVVATVTALSAAEADGDLQTIVAVGATNSIRRKYLGLQSGLHTLIGTLLAIPLTLVLYKTVISATGSYRSVGSFGVWDSGTLLIPWSGLALLMIALPAAIGLVTVASVRSAPTTPPRRAT